MHTLPRDALLHALEYLEPMELRAMALVSRWHNSLQQHEALWEALFRHRWNHANFFMDPCMRIQLSPALCAAYPRSSDAFRFLTHCVDRVPSFADICLTNTHATASTTNHRYSFISKTIMCLTCFSSIEPVAYDNGQVVTMALAKGGVGGNRCVRANVPFQMMPRVAVFQTTDRTWFVDVVYDGYFEISIADPINPMRDDATLDMCIAIGVASPDFEVVDQQPGWDDNSYGYHSDDGHFFTSGQPHPFAATFGMHDTIGCGIQRDMTTHDSILYFTKNGQRLGGTFPCLHDELFPVVGIDADYTVRLNFGHEPFRCRPPPSTEGDTSALVALQAQPWPAAPTRPRSMWQNMLAAVDVFAKRTTSLMYCSN
ncbi:hypothetical protein DYB37_002589 [Aphanomyces astaci]|uniref:F-box domain-containing protein n=2 Tax=Aphanomyces astaci TaxID=112090 RepID=A0A3R6XKP8_APHAT|nr:hypothetical protein DYB35_002651 [Aphanomyces astaci]RHZ24600.1 hypothetical protein DYB37_002589 [Aphanomyces astaci]